MKTQAKLRDDLPPLPDRMKHLPVDPERGYPVPWFTPWHEGRPEFRAMDGRKLDLALSCRLCWVCGAPLVPEKVFLIGPMCVVNRISAEPPSHRECAEFAVKACPFLSKPHMTRRDNSDIDTVKPAGEMIERNPGVTILWATQRFELIRMSNGVLCSIGEPTRVECYAEGRAATPEEVSRSFETGLPNLMRMAVEEGAAAVEELGRMSDVARTILGIAGVRSHAEAPRA